MTFLLHTYLRVFRKRMHLSQREVAFLLGASSQAVIAQHESLVRLPQTRSLLKYEALFGSSAGVLFPRLRREAEQELAIRLKALIERLDQRSGLSPARKLEILTSLIERIDASHL